MTKRSLYLAAALVATLLLACATHSAEKDAKPVEVYGAIGCNSAYTLWVLFENGKLVMIDEDSGVSLKQMRDRLVGVPSQIRHFDHNCPIQT